MSRIPDAEAKGLVNPVLRIVILVFLAFRRLTP
jgi:hypothetical protein